MSRNERFLKNSLFCVSFLLVSLFFLGSALSAEIKKEKPFNPDSQGKSAPPVTTVVSANRREVPIEKVSRAVTVITRKEIERSGKVFLMDLLRGLPGVHIVQLGTFGREAHAIIRGTNKESTLITLDGVQMNNGNQSLAAIQHMTTADIERIEIVRGAQSVLYGADAAGGMINIVTKADHKKGVHGGAEFQYGTFETFYEEGNLSVGYDPFSFSGAAGRLDTDGLSDNDGYENTTARAHAKLQVTDNSDLDVSFHHFNSIVGIDDGLVGGRFRSDPNRNSRANQQVVNSKYTLGLTNGWEQYFQYSLFHDSGLSNDPRNVGAGGADPESALFRLNSNRHTFEYQSDFYIKDFDVITLGYELENSAVQSKSSTKYNRITRNHGWFLQNELTLWQVWTLVAGIRFDRHELYGLESSPLFSTGLWIEKTQTKLKGSLGRAFRAPTFNQLFFPNFGVPTLSPETSWSWDAGFEQFYGDKRGSFSTMYFDSRTENLIQNLALATNIGRAHSQGVEIEHKIKLTEGLYFTTAYTYTHARDRSNQKRLARIPRHEGKLGLTYDWWRFHFTGDWVWVGVREDTNAVRLKAYQRVDAALFYDLTKYMQIYGRVENATNDEYREANGFDMPYTGFYVGSKANF